MDIDEAFYSAVSLLKRLIGTPSLSRQEDGVATLLQEFIVEWGYTPMRHNNNVWIMPDCFDTDKPTILLNSHIDTVRPVAGWKRNPYEAQEKEGVLWGLGSNDAGASVVSLLHVFHLLAKSKQAYNLIFLASAEEEVSGKNGIESVLPLLPPIALGIVGEPTGMQPAIAEKGLMVLDCEVTGISGHAARNEGVNAIYKALPVIEAFRVFRFPLESDLLGPVKLTVTQIEAGTQHNVIPDCCRFVVDVRTNECYSNEEAFGLLQEAMECRIDSRSRRLNSSRISPSHPFVERCRMLGLTPFGSPTLSDQALMSFDSVKMGPGDSRRSHTADEYIYTDEIREAISIYLKLLDGLSI